MRHIVSSGVRRYTFMKRSDLKADEAPVVFTQAGARQLVDGLMRNTMANRILRTLLKDVAAFAVLAKLGDVEVSAQLVKRLVSGEIVVVAADPMAVAGKKTQDASKEEEPQPPPKILAATAQDDVHWIKFKVVDDKEQPIKGIKLRLALPGKPAQSHGVNGAHLHLKDLAPGTCDVEAIECDDGYEVVEFKG